MRVSQDADRLFGALYSDNSVVDGHLDDLRVEIRNMETNVGIEEGPTEFPIGPDNLVEFRVFHTNFHGNNLNAYCRFNIEVTDDENPVRDFLSLPPTAVAVSGLATFGCAANDGRSRL